MPQHVLLNNISHQQTRVLHRFAAEYGDNLASVPVMPNEFTELQKEYPLLFRRQQPNGPYQALALLGFEAGENLFLEPQMPSGWAARQIPAMLERGPFLIGMQHRQEEGQHQEVAVIHIDMDHPKVNQPQGKALFLEYGGNSPYLEFVSACLTQLHQGMAMAPRLYALIEELDLFEPINIDIELHSGEKLRLTGYATISEQRLEQLDAQKLHGLHQAGALPLCYAAMASLSNIRQLIDKKNQRLGQPSKGA